MKEGLSRTGLIQLFKNELCDTHCEETDTPAGEQFVVDYTKLPLYLLQIIKKLNSKVDELESLVNLLISKPAIAKWMDKNKPT